MFYVYDMNPLVLMVNFSPCVSVLGHAISGGFHFSPSLAGLQERLRSLKRREGKEKSFLGN